jgi:NADH dehydrogenase
MRVAITGGTGFVGRHLARALTDAGHKAVALSRRVGCDVGDLQALTDAFRGCDAVVHCAGINRETGGQTFAKIHVKGTQNVVAASCAARVRHLSVISFLRARPCCGSGYHESKWAAEEIVRGAPLAWTVLKAGVIYGSGDNMLDHLSRAFHTFPVFGLVGFAPRGVRPLAIEDLVRVLVQAPEDARLHGKTFAVMGPEALTLEEAVRRVAGVIGKRPTFVRLPIRFHACLAWVAERTMREPVVSRAQVRILSEGLVEALPVADDLPQDLAPRLEFSPDRIRRGLPLARRYGLGDLKCSRRAR